MKAASSSRQAGINASGTKRPPKLPKWPRPSGADMNAEASTMQLLSLIKVRPGAPHKVCHARQVLHSRCRLHARRHVDTPGVGGFEHRRDIEIGESTGGDHRASELPSRQIVPRVRLTAARSGAVYQDGINFQIFELKKLVTIHGEGLDDVHVATAQRGNQFIGKRTVHLGDVHAGTVDTSQDKIGRIVPKYPYAKYRPFGDAGNFVGLLDGQLTPGLRENESDGVGTGFADRVRVVNRGDAPDLHQRAQVSEVKHDGPW